MSVSSSSKIIFGFEFSAVPEKLREMVNEAIDDGTIDSASPYYDAERNDWIVGQAMKGTCYNTLADLQIECNLNSFKEEYKECSRILTEVSKAGVPLRWYFTPDMY